MVILAMVWKRLILHCKTWMRYMKSEGCWLVQHQRFLIHVAEYYQAPNYALNSVLLYSMSHGIQSSRAFYVVFGCITCTDVNRSRHKMRPGNAKPSSSILFCALSALDLFLQKVKTFSTNTAQTSLQLLQTFIWSNPFAGIQRFFRSDLIRFTPSKL